MKPTDHPNVAPLWTPALFAASVLAAAYFSVRDGRVSMAYIAAGFAIATCVWVVFDAPHFGMHPVRWAVACFFLWIVAFPLYSIRRALRDRRPQARSPLLPGWHPDPWRQAAERWWDGYGWSDRTRDAAT